MNKQTATSCSFSRFFVALGAALFSVLAARADYENTVLADTPLAYYPLNLDVPLERLIPWVTYWYSIWSHRRDGVWKGYVQVDLAPDDDADAHTLLTSLVAAGARP